MLALVISIALALGVLFLAEEILPKKLKTRPEISRKLVHITHGIAAATWPFFVSMRIIIMVEVLFFICVFWAHKLRMFSSLSDIDRKTWGEFLFPIGIIAVALLHPNQWIFAAAVLHLGLADAFAAIVGTSRGKKHRYRVFGSEKTVEGTLTFWMVSLLITFWVTVVVVSTGLINAAVPLILLLPPAMALLENAGIYGTDNFLIPVVVTLVFRLLQMV